MAPTDRVATRILSSGGRPVAHYVRVYRLRITRADGSEDSRELGAPVLRAGAQPGNELVLTDEAVSRIHFEIVAEPTGFRLRDLGSTNGTFVDGYRVTDIYLKPGARIRAGRTQMTFEVLEAEKSVSLDPDDHFGPLVGKSAAMRAMFAILRRASLSNSTVLIQGESGTGKELIAEAIHAASPRAEKPFAVFDCAAIPANLIESELFGHERGAFTSAEAKRMGRLEEADGGTLFLDEIGELPIELQPKLLRVLESKELRRLGGDRSRKVDVRIVAATNRDLAAEVNRGAFRHDLYYRLAVVRIAVPPLRERIDDLPMLVEHFLHHALADTESVRAVLTHTTPEIWARLEAHPWRGNVRELRNAVERTLALGAQDLADGLELTLGAEAARAAPRPREASTDGDGSEAPILFQDAKKEVLARFERDYFAKLWTQTGGNISEISRRSGMERSHIRAYLRRHGVGDSK